MLSEEVSIKDEALEELGEEIERLKLEQESTSGKDSEKVQEMASLRTQLKDAEGKEQKLQEEMRKLEQQVKDAQKKEQTQMAILARIKKEQVSFSGCSGRLASSRVMSLIYESCLYSKF